MISICSYRVKAKSSTALTSSLLFTLSCFKTPCWLRVAIENMILKKSLFNGITSLIPLQVNKVARLFFFFKNYTVITALEWLTCSDRTDYIDILYDCFPHIYFVFQQRFKPSGKAFRPS